MNNPYTDLIHDAFWRTGALETHPLSPESYYRKAFELDKSDRVLTAGSCFAQHISRAMRSVGVNVMDYELPPSTIDEKVAQRFGYLTYSARYANIYTARQLRQLLQEAFESSTSPDPVWEKDGAFYDSMRPSVEPQGLRSPDEVAAHRVQHLAAVRRLVEDVDVFIFTLGLTECWGLTGTDWVFPTAPGTISGQYDPDRYHFVNFDYEDVLADMRAAMELIRKHSRSDCLRFLLTVSPVPLTATYSGDHVMVATTYSKSVLRAVAGKLEAEDPNVAYFPSFEMVTAPLSRGIFYDANWRTVNPAGVQVIMSTFLASHELSLSTSQTQDLKAISADRISATASVNSEDEVACEEALLAAFAPR
jgi:GSCFA family protein